MFASRIHALHVRSEGAAKKESRSGDVQNASRVNG